MAMATAITGRKQLVFDWTAVDRNRRTKTGEITAPNIKIAKLLLKQQGLEVRKIRRHSSHSFRIGGRVKTRDIVFSSRQLATMIEAGIPIAQALHGVAQGNSKKALATLLNEIRHEVETGTPLSAALRKHPKHFNRLYTSLVAVGEESGTLDELMESIATYLEKMESIKRKIRAALFYPAMVILVMFVVVALLLIVVIPVFEELFRDFGAHLPILTLWVVDVSHSVRSHWMAILLGTMIGVTLLVVSYRRSGNMRHLMDRAVLRTPVFGPIIRKAVIARITRTLGTMFGAGVPIINSLDTVSQAAGNRLYGQALEQIREEVATGRTLESTMSETGLFPGMVLQMVKTGEESGELERMLNKIAEFYEDEVDNAVSTISSLVEPILIVILGIVVGIIVIAMYLPIFKMAAVF